MQPFPIVIRHVAALVLSVVATHAWAADYPKPSEADFVARDFKFSSGETLPEVRIHYRTFGRIERDANGHATNVVLIGHGTGGRRSSRGRSRRARCVRRCGSGCGLPATSRH